MRVNRGRLDLRSLAPNQACTITTGITSITLVHLNRSIQMNLYLKGVAPMHNSDLITSIEDESGEGPLTSWLHLDALAPNRLYRLTVTSFDDKGRPSGGEIRDETPEEPVRPRVTDARSLIGKIFKKRR